MVTPQGVTNLDVGIQEGKIAALALPGTLEGKARRVIDATGKIVLPGGIEPYAHIAIPVPEMVAERSCALVLFDPSNPQDAVLVAVYT